MSNINSSTPNWLLILHSMMYAGGCFVVSMYFYILIEVQPVFSVKRYNSLLTCNLLRKYKFCSYVYL